MKPALFERKMSPVQFNRPKTKTGLQNFGIYFKPLSSGVEATSIVIVFIDSSMESLMNAASAISDSSSSMRVSEKSLEVIN